ncbi:MAG: hypothetical protein H6629_07485 [Calditrichae bacterium]|nr:hypothetical protein [Calditrichia bacterium]
MSTVLEGSIRKHEDNIRVTAQLIRTNDESHIWAESYDKNSMMCLTLQDDVAKSIAEALHVQLSPKAIAAIEENSKNRIRAYTNS